MRAADTNLQDTPANPASIPAPVIDSVRCGGNVLKRELYTQLITTKDLLELTACDAVRRQISSFHLHRLELPAGAFRGSESIDRLGRIHIYKHGLADVAYHLAIDPTGGIWLGRNWNRPPASLKGQNGDESSGPFALLLIDYPECWNVLSAPNGAIRAAAKVITILQRGLKILPKQMLCVEAGTGLDLAQTGGISASQSAARNSWHGQLLRELRKSKRADLRAARAKPRRSRGSGAGSAVSKPVPFPDDALLVHDIARAFAATAGKASETDAGFPQIDVKLLMGNDPVTSAHCDVRLGTAENQRMDQRDEISSAARSPVDLARHVVNLNQGAFSTDGRVTTRKEDVDAIFDVHLQQKLNQQPAGTPLRVLFFSHGGLVSEQAGIEIAEKHIDWWLGNDIYPIYFIWETGFFETLNQMLSRAADRIAGAFGFRGARGVSRDLADWTSDPAIEAIARTLQGPLIWDGMKHAAKLGVEPAGGARYVAGKLGKFCKANDGRVELHAIGHSAGSIFHAHFLPTAIELGLPIPFRTVSFLAPAVRVDMFKEKLLKRLGGDITKLTIFTMKDQLERDDFTGELFNVPIYNKSLLYLIHQALEPQARTPLLGMDVALRGDPELRAVFGLDGQESQKGEVVFSKSASLRGRSASQSISHGGFDDDAATMESAARRILNIEDAVLLKQTYRADRRMASRFRDPRLPENQVSRFDRLAGRAADGRVSADARFSVNSRAGGRRLALCVGIDNYPAKPLAGCVNDANAWRTALERLGFDASLLPESQATRAGILTALRELIGSGGPGDVLVFQYAGHGTSVDDLNGDEADGDTPGQDEAMCPIDYADGEFIIDDDLAEVFAGIPAGVNVTCFFDCCHSGTISRLAIGSPALRARGRDERSRFMVATPAMQQAHRAYRAGRGGMGADSRSVARGPDSMGEAVFSACRSHEVAWESDGHGDFTRLALPLLSGEQTHAQFESAVIAAFGANPRQHPNLDCAQQSREQQLLQPRGAAAATDMSRPPAPMTAAAVAGVQMSVVDHLRAIGHLLSGPLP